MGCMLWSCAHSVEDGDFGPGTSVDGGGGTANAAGSENGGAAGQGAMAGTGASSGTGATAGVGANGGTGGGTSGTGATGGTAATGGTGATGGYGGTGTTGGTGGYGGTGATGGTGGYGGTGATGGTGGYGGSGGSDCLISASDPVCDNCLQTQCYYECAACSSNWECLDLLDCVNSCYDDFCVDDCTWMYPDGVDDLLAFLGSSTGCVTLACYYECG